MPRSKKFFKKRSSCRLFQDENPEQEKNEQATSVESAVPQEVGLEVSPATETESSSCTSASRKKLENSFEKEDEFEDASVEDAGIELMDLGIFSQALRAFAKCSECDEGDCVTVKSVGRKGLATKMNLYCEACSSSLVFYSSKKRTVSLSPDTTGERYDVNVRFVYALRSIGKGQTAGNTLCAIMNLPPPVTKFNLYNKFLAEAAEIVSVESMKAAVKEAIEENEGETNISAAFDGSWQRRGHNSKNGVMTATSVDTGKVLDVAVLTKHCRCSEKLEDLHEVKCEANFKGASGGMEVTGACQIFERSEATRGVRYTEYLGDGDSKAFKSVVEKQPYGAGVTVKKLECLGHVQKRMGSRLRRLKTAQKGVKLADGRSLGGKNRLTDGVVDLLQKYYGLAIRRNVDDIKKMKKAIWATFFHKLSTDSEPQHGLCEEGEDSWCGYVKAKVLGTTYEHKNSLPKAVMEAIKPIYRDLTNDSLLQKCLHGGTQNANESFNSVVWTRVPKTVFVSKTTFDFGVHDAIISFNNGNIGRCRVVKQLGMVAGHHMVRAMRSADAERMRSADKAVSDFERAARQKRRNTKRRLDEAENDEDDPAYGAGIA
jgi:hypothetical protein